MRSDLYFTAKGKVMKTRVLLVVLILVALVVILLLSAQNAQAPADSASEGGIGMLTVFPAGYPPVDNTKAPAWALLEIVII
jgi:hypothetical protein